MKAKLQDLKRRIQAAWRVLTELNYYVYTRKAGERGYTSSYQCFKYDMIRITNDCEEITPGSLHDAVKMHNTIYQAEQILIDAQNDEMDNE